MNNISLFSHGNRNPDIRILITFISYIRYAVIFTQETGEKTWHLKFSVVCFMKSSNNWILVNTTEKRVLDGEGSDSTNSEKLKYLLQLRTRQEHVRNDMQFSHRLMVPLSLRAALNDVYLSIPNSHRNETPLKFVLDGDRPKKFIEIIKNRTEESSFQQKNDIIAQPRMQYRGQSVSRIF